MHGDSTGLLLVVELTRAMVPQTANQNLAVAAFGGLPSRECPDLANGHHSHCSPASGLEYRSPAGMVAGI